MCTQDLERTCTEAREHEPRSNGEKYLHSHGRQVEAKSSVGIEHETGLSVLLTEVRGGDEKKRHAGEGSEEIATVRDGKPWGTGNAG